MLNLLLSSDAAVMLAGAAYLLGYASGGALVGLILWPRVRRANSGRERLLRMALEDRDRRIAALERAA